MFVKYKISLFSLDEITKGFVFNIGGKTTILSQNHLKLYLN